MAPMSSSYGGIIEKPKFNPTDLETPRTIGSHFELPNVASESEYNGLCFSVQSTSVAKLG
jgi:hypothetical protein